MSSRKDEPYDLAPGHVAIGRIVAAHGLRGDLRVQPLTARVEYFAAGRVVWIGGSPHDVESSRPQKNVLLVKLSGVDSADAAESLRGQSLSLLEVELGPLEDDEYYAHQLIGMEVEEKGGEHLGRIVEILPTGSNDVYVVQGPRGEILLPAIDDVIVEVDVAAGKMTVSLMDGMLSEQRG